MTGKRKLIALGITAGCIGAAVLAINWSLLSAAEGREWEANDDIGIRGYVLWADELEYSSPLEWRLMGLSSTMQAHLEQRRREAAAIEAKLPKAPPPLADAERRKKIRADYEKSAQELHLAPAMANAMLALIDDANARNAEIPYRLTTNSTVDPRGDQDLEVLASMQGNPPTFDPGTGCSWDLRQKAQSIEMTNLGADTKGIFITATLQDAAEPLLLTITTEGQSSELRVRQLRATVEVNVVPPNGVAVRASHEVRLGSFGLDTKVRQGRPLANEEIYIKEIHKLASNVCFEACALLGTRDRLPDEK